MAVALVVLAGGPLWAVPAEAKVGLDGEQRAVAALVRARFPAAQRGHAVRVAWCESRLRARATGHNRNGTVDRGVFQLNSGGTMQGLGLSAADALEAEANIDGAYRLWRRAGWRPWRSSAHCHRA